MNSQPYLTVSIPFLTRISFPVGGPSDHFKYDFQLQHLHCAWIPKSGFFLVCIIFFIFRRQCTDFPSLAGSYQKAWTWARTPQLLREGPLRRETFCYYLTYVLFVVLVVALYDCDSFSHFLLSIADHP